VVLLGGALWMGAAVAAAQTTPMRLLVSNGVKAALTAVAPSCESITRTTVRAEFNTSSALLKEATSGALFDLAVMTAEAVDALVGTGAVIAASRRPVAKTVIGVGVRAGTAKPDLGTAAAVRASLLESRSITYASDGASRPFLEGMFRKLGIADEMAAKAQLEQGSVRATERVVDGRTQLVLTLVSEIRPVKGLELAGALPREFQGETSFAAALGAKSAHADVAAQLLACLTAPQTAAAYASVGLERVGK
jgi:molybdate transport system substrate-binding protein